MLILREGGWVQASRKNKNKKNIIKAKPERPFNNFVASRSGDGEFYVANGRFATDCKATKL